MTKPMMLACCSFTDQYKEAGKNLFQFITIRSVLVAVLFTSTFAGASASYDSAFEAMIADATNPEKSFLFATEAIKQGDVRGAIAALERILQIKPGLANIQLELGVLYLRLGSMELARHHLRNALTSPEIPSWVRDRARAYYARAKEADSSHTFSGSLFAAYSYDDNASAAPDSINVRVNGFDGFLREEDTAQGDGSQELSGRISYIYSFDSQAGNQLEFDANTYNRWYNEQTDLNINQLRLELGPHFYFGEALTPSWSFKPSVRANALLLDADKYLESFGANLNFSKSFSAAYLIEGNLGWDDQSYFDSPSRFASDRSGGLLAANLQLFYLLLPTTQLSGTLGVQQRDSDAAYESFSEPFVRLGVTQYISSPFELTQRALSLSLYTTFRTTKYDAPDPAVDPDVVREDDRLDIALYAGLPVSRALTLVLQLRFTQQDSSLPNYEYDNSGSSLGLTFNF